MDHCWDFHCCIHGVDEWLRPGTRYTYVIRCGECGHLYNSKFSLWWAYVKGGWRVPPTLRTKLKMLTVKADAILFCPHCIHDF